MRRPRPGLAGADVAGLAVAGWKLVIFPAALVVLQRDSVRAECGERRRERLTPGETEFCARV